MFRKIGELVTKHPLAVISIWVILLALIAPMAASIGDRLEYDTSQSMPGELEAIKAMDAYKEAFQAESDNSILIPVVSDNKTEAKLFIEELNHTVGNDPAITNVSATVSIHDIYQEALVNASPELYTGLHDLYNNTTSVNEELYNATNTVANANRNVYYLRDNVTKINSELYKAWGQAAGASQQMYDARKGIVEANSGLYQIKAAPDMIYGVPHSFVSIYQQANSSELNDSVSSLTAYNTMKGQVSGPASGYLDAFYSAWTAAGYNPNPDDRAKAAISTVFPPVHAGITDPAQKQLFQAAYAGLTYDNYAADEKAFCVNTVMAAQNLPASNKPQLEAAYDLGPNSSTDAIDSLVLSVITAGMDGDAASKARELYYLGNDKSRIGSYIVDNAVNAQNNSTIQDMIRDAWNLGSQATNETFDKYTIRKATDDMNASEKADFLEIYGWGPNPNATVIRDYVFEKAGEDLNQSELDFMHEVYDLGENPDNQTVKSFVVKKVNDELNLTGNLSYMYALLNLDRNASKTEVENFAREWVLSHDSDNPGILPGAISRDLVAGNVTLYIVKVKGSDGSEWSNRNMVAIRAHVNQLLTGGAYPDTKAYVTGSTAMSQDMKESSMKDTATIDQVSILLILILLALYFRSIASPIIPLVITGISIAVSLGLMSFIGQFTSISFVAMTFMMVMMMGAGTDYCVFTLSRYAEERKAGRCVKEAIIATIEHAGKSVASSGSTAVIGFGALMLVYEGIFRSIGIAASLGIAVSMLAALTLLPAIMTILGDRVFWPKKVESMARKSIFMDFWEKFTRKVISKAPTVVVTMCALVLVASLFLPQLALGNDTLSMISPDLESKAGYDVINEEFGSGNMGKLMILLQYPQDVTDGSGNISQATLGKIEQVSSLVAATEGIDKVYSATRPDGQTINYRNLSAYSIIDRAYYQASMNGSLGKDNMTVVLYASFNGSPYSEESGQAIDSIRSKLADYAGAEGDGVKVLTGGATTSLYDYQNSVTSKYGLVIAIVLSGVFIVLMVVLRSVLTPLRLIVTLLMSVILTLAACIIVFQFLGGTIISWIIPIVLFCVLMGLGVDYDIFLVSRVREEVLKGKSDEDAIVDAIKSTGTIITLCGTVMALAFGSMMVSSNLELRQIGFVLCVAILIDSTLIRLVLVPAVMVLLKKYNWWIPLVGHSHQK